MNRAHSLPAVALLALLLAGCGPRRATPPPTATQAATQAATATPAGREPTPRPSATPAARPSPNPPPATATPDAAQAKLLAAIDAIGREMETVRGLQATVPIRRGIMSRDELGEYLAAEFDEDYPPAEIEGDTRTMAAFDFMPEDFDLRTALLDVYTEQILGFYDDEAQALYVVSDSGLDLLARLTLAHELTHGLQDEHFDLEAFLDEEQLSDDEILARQALAEGDASVAMTRYLMAHWAEVGPDDLAALSDDLGEQSALNTAPPIISATLAFPYLYGEQFVLALLDGGWQAVDAAYANPPSSTEQVLHPEKYLAGDEPQVVALPPLTDTLGAGWHLADSTTLGEFQLRFYLDQQLGEAAADTAGTGWDGDRFAVHVRGDDEVLVLLTAWDSAADRQEFVAAYTAYAMAKYGLAGSRSGDRLSWDTAGQAATLAWAETTALIILGPDRATVDRVAAVVRP